MTSERLLPKTLTNPVPNEGRREPRYSAPDGVKMTLRAAPESEGQEEATGEPVLLVDISLRGIGIATGRFIEPGTTVTLRWGTRRIEGEIRHCRATSTGYLAGAIVYQTVDEPARRLDWESLLNRNRQDSQRAVMTVH